MVAQEPVQAAIWNALNHYSYADAIFLAEHLYAESGSDEALYLLSTAYYRSGKARRAYTLLQQKGCPNAQCRYLMARCCIDISKLSEAECALSGNSTKPKSQEDLVSEFGDSACYTAQLLGYIFSKTERCAKSAEQYKRSLKLNPFLWSSFQSLCHIGEKPDATKIFHPGSIVVPSCINNPPPTVTVHQPTPIISQQTTPQCFSNPETPVMQPMMQLSSQMISPSPGPENISHHDMTPENTGNGGTVSPPPPLRPRLRAQVRPARGVLSHTAALSPLTPSFGVLPLESTPSPSNCYITPPNPIMVDSSELLRAPRTGSRRTKMTPQHSTSFNALNQSSLDNSMTDSLIRPTRAAKENKKTQSQKKNFACPTAPKKMTKTRRGKTNQELNELNKADTLENKKAAITSTIASVYKQSAESMMGLLQSVGRAYSALCQFDCPAALQLFSSPPANHYHTGWVLCQVGRAHFEMADYQKACQIFSVVRELAPHHIEGLELYSTALWHLQKEVRLSTLAHELTELDNNSPEAWCATGNCFSLQKEHDVAIKFFQRAIQVEPNFAYAYTLLGHEYVLTEELDKAVACFRNAIRTDTRHYNAWYGIGLIYYKQEKFALAEVHFRKALCINSQSSVLLCHIGVVQHALKKSESALSTLNRAISIDPKNPLCKFHRASILFATDRHREALSELEELKQLVPKESLVYFLIGKVHKKLGNTHMALMNFSWAMDLDPKGANNQIKEAIDKRYVTDDDFSGTPTGLEDPSAADMMNNIISNSIMRVDDMQLQAVESDDSL